MTTQKVTLISSQTPAVLIITGQAGALYAPDPPV